MAHQVLNARQSTLLQASQSRATQHSVQCTALPRQAAAKASSRNTLRREFKLAKLQSTAPRPLRASAVKVTASKGNSAVDGKPTVVITGASSGLGLNGAKALADSGKWHIIMACRDYLKAEKAARALDIPKSAYTIMHLDLACLESVRQFVENFRATGRSLDALVANAAVYLPTATEPRFTAEGFELSVGTNHLGHFLLCNLLLEDLAKSKHPSKRMVIVGSITGNTNTLAGNVPPKADLGNLSGLAAGLDESTTAMIDGLEFNGAKAYKDSKVCNMLTMREFNRRFHDSTGIVFSSLYPGCIATTGLFREHYTVFKKLFPPFQQYITKGYVSEAEAGRRLAQVVSDPALGAQSGVYWSWDSTKGSFVNEVSDEVKDDEKASKLWEISEKLVGLTPAAVKPRQKAFI